MLQLAGMLIVVKNKISRASSLQNSSKTDFSFLYLFVMSGINCPTKAELRDAAFQRLFRTLCFPAKAVLGL